VLLLLPGEILPHLLNIPPTSIKPISQYQIMPVSAPAPYRGVTSKLTLERATNEGGINNSACGFDWAIVWSRRSNATSIRTAGGWRSS
jgi:hypothetical protein